MSELSKRKEIKKIMDGIFAAKTPVKKIEILKYEEHDGIVLTALVLDHTCDTLFRLNRNADGTYHAKDYAW